MKNVEIERYRYQRKPDPCYECGKNLKTKQPVMCVGYDDWGGHYLCLPCAEQALTELRALAAGGKE